MTGLRWTPEQLRAHQARTSGHGIAEPAAHRAASQAKKSAASASAGGKTRLQALGRLKDGEMNATEARYAAHLDAQKAAGDIVWWAFEAIKLKLAPNTHLTVDFFVMHADGRLVAIDVKGAKAIVTDDSRAKIKIAADKFPWPFQLVYPQKKADGGGWDIEKI